MSVDRGTGPPRGGAAGALVGGLAVAAHGAAGGGYPDSAEFALLLAVSVVAGCAAAARGSRPVVGADLSRAGGTFARTPSNALAGGGFRLLAVLGLGQAAGHVVLGGMTGHAGGGSHVAQTSSSMAGLVPGGWMLFAHIVATFVCALLILAAERFYGLVSSVIRAVRYAPRTPLVAEPPLRSRRGASFYVHLPKVSTGPRAPPACV
ncbi:hypothetical protein IU433_11830 [Nocardia puris]|uniref:hypothetical protein n=1 Tax=Nocardia puris TaxID=208602 RepID=UPI0018959C36|nr:hypothetical protein [Nocardia puris]MBF6214186.1 hypothetical protein [Nocardia puris]MBF6365324.1 hypothetical protein [Nocardia puris]MBF6459726.1 hypothetical protein [Nocardia puris]